MDFELTRIENDEQLLPQLEAIKNAENIRLLIPFAKAYLGMFYVIDNRLAAKDKVRLIANTKLADALFYGFESCLNKNYVPSVEKIAQANTDKNEYAEGYVILAGLDLIAKKELANVSNLNLSLIEQAIAFHFANKSSFTNIWFDYLLDHHIDKVAPAICRYWVAMLKNNATYLPGNNLLFTHKPNKQLISYSILPLLENWAACKEKTLYQLLSLAFKYSDAKDFLIVCEHVLDNDKNLNEKTRLYWLTSAYLISPNKYSSKLSTYVGRVKMKIMSLLDFIIIIIKAKDEININLNSKLVAQLIRMIAPVFPPQHHVYGALGELDINSKNVMLLFYFLACSKDKDVAGELKSLRKARVMKIYSAVIDDVLELHIRKNNEGDFKMPTFEAYIENLFENHCLQGRSNKFDLR